ncbi:MAG: thiol:disulfide interchange protein DsbA/DsbL [Burkholderiales bacterium]
MSARRFAAAAHRTTGLLILFAAFALSTAAFAQDALKAGTDYRVIKQQPAPHDGKIGVTEFFYYRCPHCYRFETFLVDWLKHPPADVAFKRVPVVWQPSSVAPAQAFYALHASGQFDKLHEKLFASYHEGNELNSGEAVGDWVAKHGGDRKKFMAAWNSDAVKKQVAQARQMTRDYEIEGVPSMVVAGRYLTSSGMSKGEEKLIGVVDKLIALARQKPAAK